jgi:iron-sulfur cluster assembly accessory protein
MGPHLGRAVAPRPDAPYLSRESRRKRLQPKQAENNGNMTGITLTERAARRIHHVLEGERTGAMLRISVNGGGCSGFQYAFDISTDRAADDILVERDGAVVVVDPMSLQFLEGSTVDFVDDLIGQSFKVQNPNATASCGCGTSFSV